MVFVKPWLESPLSWRDEAERPKNLRLEIPQTMTNISMKRLPLRLRPHLLISPDSLILASRTRRSGQAAAAVQSSTTRHGAKCLKVGAAPESSVIVLSSMPGTPLYSKHCVPFGATGPSMIFKHAKAPTSVPTNISTCS